MYRAAACRRRRQEEEEEEGEVRRERGESRISSLLAVTLRK